MDELLLILFPGEAFDAQKKWSKEHLYWNKDPHLVWLFKGVKINNWSCQIISVYKNNPILYRFAILSATNYKGQQSHFASKMPKKIIFLSSDIYTRLEVIRNTRRR